MRDRRHDGRGVDGARRTTGGDVRARVAPPLALEALEPRRLLAAGNILVGVSRSESDVATYDIVEYTPDGQLLQTVYAPKDGVGIVRDFVIDPDGKLQVLHFGASLATTTPGAPGEAATFRTVEGWSLVNATYFGGIDAIGRYLFVTDMKTGGDTDPGQSGLIRLDRENGYAATRFAQGLDFNDVTIGVDGLVYGLVSPPGQPAASDVIRFDPVTLEQKGSVTLPGANVGAVVVDEDGGFFVGTAGGGLLKVTPDGTAIKQDGSINATDLTLTDNGILLASGGDLVRTYDMELNLLSTFNTFTFLGVAFSAWSTDDVKLPDTAAPQATATIDQPAAGATTFTVRVTYTDDQEVDRDTIDAGDVVATVPTGGTRAATLESVSGTGRTVTATYELPVPPAGGSYGVRLNSGQVKDAAGNAAAQQSLGTAVSGDPAPPGAQPEVGVSLDGGAALSDGQTTAVDFGAVAIAAAAGPTRTFAVRNDGTAAMALSLGAAPAGFEVVEGLSASIAPGASDTFTLRLLATAPAGQRSGTLSIATNDADENPFDFPVRGEVVATLPPGGTPAPEVAVLVNGAPIASGATLDLGARDPGELAPSVTLTVRNEGTADLQLGTAITMPAGYALAGVPASGVLAPGASADLTVTLVATQAGTFAGAMAMTTNDADENPFTLNLTGAVSSTLPPVGSGIAVTALKASRIPAVVISGATGGKSPTGTLAVTLRNETGGSFAGLVTVAVHASSDGVLDAGDAQIAAVTKTLKLRAGATGKPVKIKVPLGAMPVGQKTLLASATANNATATGAPGPTVSVEAARVNLVGLPGAGAGKPLLAGKRATLAVPLQNTGNVATSKAPVTYTLVFTTDGTDAGKVFETTSVAKVSLKAGAGRPQKLNLTLPASTALPPGTYTLLVRLSADLNATNGQTVALLPVTVV